MVDDDAMIRRLVTNVLEAEGRRVETATNGAEALEALDRGGFDVVVLDVMMPGLDGVEVCRRLDHDTVKVVMLTARDDVRIEEAARAAGADAFLTKPFASSDLVAVLEGLGA